MILEWKEFHKSSSINVDLTKTEKMKKLPDKFLCFPGFLGGFLVGFAVVLGFHVHSGFGFHHSVVEDGFHVHCGGLTVVDVVVLDGFFNSSVDSSSPGFSSEWLSQELVPGQSQICRF